MIRALLALAAAASLACSAVPTQIILSLDTDMTQGPSATLTHLRVQVQSADAAVVWHRATYPLRVTAGGARWFELPGTLVLVAGDDARPSLEVRIDAVHDPGGDGATRAAMFSHVASVSFARGHTWTLHVFLADRCAREPRCAPTENCTPDGCVARGPDSLRDASVDRTDAVNRPSPDASSDRATIGAVADAPRDEAAIDRPDAPDGNACPSGQTRCGGTCVDARANATHCGRCDNACGDAPNADPACVAGACALRCAVGFENCDGQVRNGCELRVGRSCGGGERCVQGLTACVSGAPACRRAPLPCGTRCPGNNACDGRGMCVRAPDCGEG